MSAKEWAAVQSERERELAAARARAEREAEQQRDEARQRQIQEEIRRARELASRKQKEAELAAEKAREMYGSYRESAEDVADQTLRVLSSLKIGVTYAQYNEMIQELHFKFNKFKLSRTAIERGYESFSELDSARSALVSARDIWSLEIKYPDTCRECEEKRQAEWSRAQEAYTRAMALLADGK